MIPAAVYNMFIPFRLQQELMGIMMGADPGASAFPNDDNLFEWTATLSGSEDTAVRGTLGKAKNLPVL